MDSTFVHQARIHTVSFHGTKIQIMMVSECWRVYAVKILARHSLTLMHNVRDLFGTVRKLATWRWLQLQFITHLPRNSFITSFGMFSHLIHFCLDSSIDASNTVVRNMSNEFADTFTNFTRENFDSDTGSSGHAPSAWEGTLMAHYDGTSLAIYHRIPCLLWFM